MIIAKRHFWKAFFKISGEININLLYLCQVLCLCIFYVLSFKYTYSLEKFLAFIYQRVSYPKLNELVQDPGLTGDKTEF